MKKIVFTDSDVRSGLHDIMRTMQADTWRPDYIVGLTKGGLIPAVMLSNYMHVPMVSLHIDFTNPFHGPVSNCPMAESAFGYGKNIQNTILVVNDLNNSGKTLNWLVEDWKNSCLPNDNKWKSIWNNTVRFAVLVNNNSSDFTNVDYSVADIDTSEEPTINVVFPWDNWWYV
jgi:hypoxanthine phosphoribosyltransferase